MTNPTLSVQSVAVYSTTVVGAVASWLARSSPNRAARVRALAEDIVLCSWEDTQLSQWLSPLSSQVYKWVPGNLMLGVNPAID